MGECGQTNSACTRRTFLAGLAVAGFQGSALVAAEPTKGGAPRSALLVKPTGRDSLDSRTKLVLELDGKLRIDEPDPKKTERVRTADVKAKSTLDYYERTVFGEGAVPTVAARRYLEAGVENWIAGSAGSFQLREQCRETRMLPHNGRWEQFCESENLAAREVELLHAPLNSTALDLLLPPEPAKPDSVWVIGEEDARQVFNLEAVHRSTLEARIAKVEKGTATIRLQGTLEGSVHGVATTLEINGSFQARLARDGAMVTWVGLVVKEDREISQAEPGFTITAQVRLIREEQVARVSATAAQLRQLAADTNAAPGRWLVQLRSDLGRYSMLADRRWYFYLDSPEEAIIRMVENNTVIAQCNISQLTELKEGSQLSLEGLQADVRESVKEGFTEFLESSEKLTSSKLRLLRTVAAGVLQEVPIQWIYCHLSDDSGRRVALVFTMGADVTDRFAAADEQMTDSFELLAAPSNTEAPTAAPKLAQEQDMAAPQR